MDAQVDHSFEEIARFKASRTDRYVNDLSVMLEPDKETAALERLAAMAARESVVVWVLSELHSDFHLMPPSCRVFRLRASAVPEGAVALEVGEQVLARRLELVSDESEAEQEHPEIVFAVDWIQVAFAAARRVAVYGFRAERETELDVCLYLSGMKRSVEIPVMKSFS